MPNDILSDITFVGLHEIIERLVKENLRFSAFFPEVPELAIMDELYPSGYAHMLERTGNSVTFRVTSLQDPPLDVLQAFVDLYPGLYIRCLWREEGGREGLWVTADEGVREIRWYGPCLEAYHMNPSPEYTRCSEHRLLQNAYEVEQATQHMQSTQSSSNAAGQ